MGYKTISKISILFSLLSFSLIFILDIFYWKTSILAEGHADLSISHIFRSVVILFGVIFSISSILFWKKKNFDLMPETSTVFEKGSILLILIISLGFLVLFLIDPILFNSIALEDQIIEWLSVYTLFISSLIFIWIFIKNIKNTSVPTLSKILYLFFAIGLLLIAMEEVSWLQRVLGFEIPDYFLGNKQQEMNFHNFYTNPIENIYYFGSFLFFVVFAFLVIPFPNLRQNKVLAPFIPSPWVAVLGSLASSYNYDMWNIIFTQISFYGSIIILGILRLLMKKQIDRKIFIFSILLILLTQFIFIVKGDQFIRLWDVTEYKEFLIPLTFLIYSVNLLRKTKPEQEFNLYSF